MSPPADDAASRRVVVTGVGTISAGGFGLDGTWRRLQEGPLRPTVHRPPAPADSLAFHAFEVPDYELADLGVPARCLRWLRTEGLDGARDLRHMLGATALALSDARLPLRLEGTDPPVAVIVADESPGFEQLSRALFELAADGATGQAAPDPSTEAMYEHFVHEFFQLNTFLLPFYLARAFGFEGTGLFVNSACTSGLNALEVAAQEIRSGRSQVAVVSAADDPLSAAKYLWFRGLGLYADDGVLRPYDAEQRGTVFGDGGATFVLESLDSARRRGVEPYAELAGVGFAQDGWKIASPSPIKAKASAAMQGALDAAGLEPAELDLIVPHGVGAPASDQYEAMVLHALLADVEPWPAISTFKPLLGHNLGGSALLESALLMQAMRTGCVPPTLHHATPYPRRALPLVDHWMPRQIERALKLTCGFAGFYGAVVFRRPEDLA
ncbi:MAG: beta-ketoacyl synthase N-terminal-like domain-containing protein [Acidobacteriota bacterium]